MFGPNWSTRPRDHYRADIKEGGISYWAFRQVACRCGESRIAYQPWSLGFDEYLSHDNFFELDPVLSRNGAKPQKIVGESSQIVVDAAIDFIHQAHQAKQSFFTVVWFGSPHTPYSGLPDDVAQYANVANEQLRNRLTEISAMDRAIGKLRESLTKLGARQYIAMVLFR